MKYTAIFLKRTSSEKSANPNYEEIGKSNFKAKDKTVDFKGDTFITFIDLFSKIKGNEKIYYYDFDSGDLISFTTIIKSEIKPSDLNKFTGKSVVEGIIKGAKEKMSGSLLTMLLPIITLIIGVVIGHFIMPSVITVPIPVTPIIPSV